ncbi:hypothetical protein [Gelidibacter maritimus]|uniref:HprK-related kinase B n=1 Tax=Gelidibacter maritimus TaxID=2761487 RepID=A0A7W2R480_9FLAO|nr:hypothetical protein [Gelidibacter maritimus]MBA6153433.1 hypothetical protein [Gelidibacter maritimus]
MKVKLSPKHLTQLSHSWILWFEASNQYIVVPDALKTLMDSYLAAANEDDFEERTNGLLDLSQHDTASYYNQLRDVLVSANTPVENDLLEKSKIPTVEKTNLKEVYDFGDRSIAVNFGSHYIQNLIHPQWAHATMLSAQLPSTTFDVFNKDPHLYLFKDKQYIGHYLTTDHHLLQGQFALQIVNTLYDKEESDWIATFHASTVCNNKEAIMIIGDSGKGKSTLSAVLMANGFDVLADDFTPLSAKNQELYRFPSGISVKQGSFKTLETLFSNFEQFPIYQSTSKQVKIKYIPPIINFGQAASHFPCKKIVLVNYDAQATSEMKTIGIEKVMETLIPDSWLSPLASNAQGFLDWLKGVSCYELIYADNATAVSEFKKLFNS